MPHDLDAEASILGGIMLKNEVLALLPALEPDDFYDPKHKLIFGVMRNLEAKVMPIDAVTVSAQLRDQGRLDAIGGIGYLGELQLRVPTVDNVEVYAKLVTDKRISRDVMLMLQTLLDEGYSEHSDIRDGEDYIHAVTSSLMLIRTHGEVAITSIGALAAEEGARVLADLETRARGERVYSGVPTGFMAVDERIGGNPIGVMTLYIARPGTGKTTFGMAMSKAAKEIADMDSVLCSWEDRGQSFGQRGLAQETGIGTEKLRARKIHPDDMAALRSGIEWAQRRRTELFLDCCGMEVEQFIRRIRREQVRRKIAGQKPIRQVVVDYIQKMPLPKWARSRDEGVGHISRVLSTFAATDDLAVVVMSQLNRESEKRDDHRPRMSDIRDSGSLEQDGKVIFGIYYPHGYEPQKYNASDVYLIVLKNAQGEAMGEIGLHWDRATHAIYNSEIDYQHARAMRGR